MNKPELVEAMRQIRREESRYQTKRTLKILFVYVPIGVALVIGGLFLAAFITQ